MLSLRLSFEASDDSSLKWAVVDGAWRRGPSFVEPFRHRIVEAQALHSSNRIAFIVREAPKHRSGFEPLPEIQEVDESTFDSAVAGATAWPFNFVVVQVDDAAHTVSIRSGSWGTAPIYAVAKGGVLRAHWDAAKLYPFLNGKFDLPRVVYALVNIGYPYSRETVFSDMVHLTERSTAKWSSSMDRVSIEYPAPVPRIKARRLREDADVIGAFEQIMGFAVSQWVDGESPIGTQLSGGVNSSVVAAVLGTLCSPTVRSYGLIMPGRNGEFQAERRNELIERFGFFDHSFPGDRYLPFSEESPHARDGGFIPWSEFYYDPLGALGLQVRQDGLDVLFTGVGGDELSTLLKHENADPEPDDAIELFPPFLASAGFEAYNQAVRNLDTAPRSGVETSCIESAATNSDLFLRQGLWPAYPYFTPEVVEFARSLPPEWRKGREFQRQLLTKLGCSDRVARPQVTETFSEIMTMGLVRNHRVLIPLFEESVLAQDGLIDRAKLMRAYEHFRLSGDSSYKDVFVELAALELTFRALKAAPIEKDSQLTYS